MRTIRYWHDRLRHPRRYRELAQLLSVPHMSAAEVAELQAQRFDAIVRHAVSQTTFYADHYAALDVAVGQRVRPERLPPLRKHQVREHLDAMLARDADRAAVKLGHTGGSTGEPLNFYYTREKHERMLAGMKRGFMMSGWRPGERVMYLWGASRDVSGRGVFAREASNVLDSEMSLAAVSYSEANLAAWCRKLQSWRPVLLYGYASALAELARFMLDTATRPPASLIGAYSTAEMLDADQHRSMEAAFGCKVFNQYGCREVPNIAWECRAGGMHVFSDLVLLEADDAVDEPGRLLVTSLSDRVMPFIRYAIGDSGELVDGECDCGLPFPLMRMSMCRHNDLIVTPDGARVHPSVLNGLLYGMTAIRRYQWVQLAPARLRLDVVCEGRLPSSTIDDIQRGLQQRVHPAMQLECAYRNTIERTAAGKHRFVIGLG